MDNESVTHLILENFIFWIFVIDIIVTLNTGFYDRGTFIQKKRRILKNYFNNQFLLDLISMGPYLMLSFLQSNSRTLQMFFLLRIMKMKKILKKIKENLQLPEQMLRYLELLKLFFLVIYLAHICCCAWHYVALVNYLIINIYIKFKI